MLDFDPLQVTGKVQDVDRALAIIWLGETGLSPMANCLLIDELWPGKCSFQDRDCSLK
jgi:hypothetical protein